jgi:hypothetical protein
MQVMPDEGGGSQTFDFQILDVVDPLGADNCPFSVLRIKSARAVSLTRVTR